MVSPGVVTDGVTLFFLQKRDDLFSHRYHSHPLSAFQLIVCSCKFRSNKNLDFH